MKYLYSFILITTVFLSGCSKKLEPISKSDVIVAFGDSLTYGYGASENSSYPAKLKQKTGYNIINAGLNGDTALNGKNRIKEVISLYNPKVVILGLGGNDMLKNNSRNLKQNLEEIIIILKSKNIQVILLAEPKPNMLALSMGLNDADVYEILAKEHDILLLDNIYSKYLSKQEFKSDLIHLNDKGYELVAEDIANKLEKANLIQIEK